MHSIKSSLLVGLVYIALKAPVKFVEMVGFDIGFASTQSPRTQTTQYVLISVSGCSLHAHQVCLQVCNCIRKVLPNEYCYICHS